MTDLMQTTLTAPGGVDMALVVGASDEILHVLEESFDARLTVRGDRIVIEGNAVEVRSSSPRCSPTCSKRWRKGRPPTPTRCAVPSSCSARRSSPPPPCATMCCSPTGAGPFDRRPPARSTTSTPSATTRSLSP
ncbi:MAG: hypothetical protein ACLTDR_07080 [Adlercreutzia equolifaciens]